MKFNDDLCFSNPYNAMVSGVDKDELLYLEISFLKLIDFHLLVDPQTFESYYNHLEEISERKAVLINWSWLDPAHWSQISRKEHSTLNQSYQTFSESKLKEESDYSHMHNSSENTCSTSYSSNQNKLENGIKSDNTNTFYIKEKELGGKGLEGGGLAIGVLHDLKPVLTRQGDDDAECIREGYN